MGAEGVSELVLKDTHEQFLAGEKARVLEQHFHLTVKLSSLRLLFPSIYLMQIKKLSATSKS